MDKKQLEMDALKNRYHRLATNGKNEDSKGALRKLRRKMRNLKKTM